MRSNWPVLLVASTAVALGATGCADPAPAGDRVVRAQAYAVDSSPDSALAFFDNAYVFEGTVTAVRADRRVADSLSGGRTIEAVYTPVTVVVERSYVGDAAAGSKVTVRSMGGKAGGLRYVIDEAPAKSTFTPGTRLVIFGGVRSTLDLEPEPAITPHFVYKAAGDVFVDVTYAETPDPARTRIPAVDLRHKLEALSAKAGPRG
ncbi:hypothetical protein [Phytohabitans houttuyneae]|uniref:Lipoprotein n=1 Tax=Phytohabitans houttuyneae TaxID=1076126 RepID=A0A6V8K801_9ACTN|nr:hypothetical protein [Phytohabitans houttuyneae]GFJ81333.1 hypothetical protein Phou_055130 [Phytohabitans houttuyneae]